MIYKKVFLDDLPRWGFRGHGREGTINWAKSIGYNVKFIYGDKEGEVEIIDYDNEKSRLNIKYGNDIFNMKTGHFVNCCFGKILNVITNDFKISIGTEFVDSNRNIKITDRYHKKEKFIDKEGYHCIRKLKRYKYICKKCGYIYGDIDEYSLLKGIGCSACACRVVVEGINDIPTTAPWMVKYFQGGYDEAKKYCKGSIDKIQLKCPDCGRLKYREINHLYTSKTIACVCGDGFSYPEKFMANVLVQLGVEFKIHYSSDWSNNKEYDFCIPSLNMIIETHGMQHYKELKGFKRTLVEEQENDRIKRELALRNGIKHYIVIDCRKSEFDWTKFNVYEKLRDYLDMSNVDFRKAEEFALKNIVREVCEYWDQKEEWETVTDLSIRFKLKDKTIREYLKKGNKFNWCKYDSKEEMRKSAKKVADKNKKPVEVFKDGMSLGIFESCADLERKSEERFGVKFSNTGISAVCLGKLKTHKKYSFKYVYL